jgi:predicted enzyme related to lactoylglutathione lyase
MSRVVHFEIPADDPDRAIGFYQNVFGWQMNKWDGPQPYWLVTTGDEKQPGINGGLMKRMHPGQPVVNTIDVPSVDDYIARISQHGGEIVVPKMPIPGVGWLVYFKDTEGNIFGIMQEDAAAR